MNISINEKKYLRDLAKRVSEIAALPIINERREKWKKHNDLHSNYPLSLVFPEGSWGEILPNSSFKCISDVARNIENQLKQRIYTFEHFHDDSVINNKWYINKANWSHTGWGMTPKIIPSTTANGAWHFDPVIKKTSDLKKLKFPEPIVNEHADKEFEYFQEVFGDFLDVEITGIKHISFHLMSEYTDLRGLEEVMMDMYEEPEMLHDAMSFMTEGYKRLLKQYDKMNLFSLNNDNTYHSTGGNGFTEQLPQKNFNPDKIRYSDMWASAEAQQMALVGPKQHSEFVLEYEKQLLESFGLNGYGCCEDLTNKLDLVFEIPNIRRISISPWSDVKKCAEKMNADYIFSWKPDPSYIAFFNDKAIYDYIQKTLSIAKEHGTILEIILKDTHTCQNEPERFDKFTKITKELIQKEFGN
jgi:hypothetical protein